ncbi:DUF1573 domain-containing protein [Blastopirellula marina]
MCFTLSVIAGVIFRTTNNTEDDPDLLVAESDLALGSVWSGSKHTHIFTIQNISDHDVAILQFAMSCKCTEVMPEQLTVPSGESRQVRLIYNAESSLPDQTQGDGAPFSLVVSPVVESLSTSDRYAWTFHGKCESIFRDLAGTFQLEASRNQDETGSSFTCGIQLEPLISVDDLLVADMNSFATSVKQSRDGKSFHIEITCGSEPSPEAINTELRVTLLRNNLPVISGIPIPLSIAFPGPISMSPPAIDFGLVSPGTSVRQTLVAKMATDREGLLPISQPVGDDTNCDMRIVSATASRAILEAHLVAPKEPGFYCQDFRISACTSSGATVATVSIPVRYQVITKTP